MSRLPACLREFPADNNHMKMLHSAKVSTAITCIDGNLPTNDKQFLLPAFVFQLVFDSPLFVSDFQLSSHVLNGKMFMNFIRMRTEKIELPKTKKTSEEHQESGFQSAISYA